MLKKLVFLVVFDTCDVVYIWSISLLPPIVLDIIFENLQTIEELLLDSDAYDFDWI